MKKMIAINIYVLTIFIAFSTYKNTQYIYENRLPKTPFTIDISLSDLEMKPKDIAFDLTNSSVKLEPIYIEVIRSKPEKKIDQTEEYIDEILKQRAIAIQNRDRLNDLISTYSNDARGVRDENEIIKINNMRKILIEARDLYSSDIKGE